LPSRRKGGELTDTTDPARSSDRSCYGDPDNRVRDPHPQVNLELVSLKARMLSESADEPYATLLGLLSDYVTGDEPEARQGATYRSLAACAYGVGLRGKHQRAHWYRLARQVPLTEEQATHVLYKLRPELMKGVQE
jgi:hypothetical protein